MKRLLALSVTVLFVVSALVFAGCGGSNQSTIDNPKDDIQIKNLSASELMGVGMTVGLTDTAIPQFLTTPGDLEMGVKFAVNEFSVAGEDMFEGPVSFGVIGEIDYDNTAAKMAADFDALGESGKISAIVNTDGLYIDNLLGISNDVIGFSYDELGIDIEDIIKMLDQYTASANQYTDYLTEYSSILDSSDEITEILSEAIADNVPDDMYETEVTEYEVNGVTYKDVNVVTLTLEDDVLSDVIIDTVAGIAKVDGVSDILDEAFGGSGFDTSMIPDLDDLGITVSITAAVTNSVDTIYLDISLIRDTGMGDGVSGVALRFSNTDNYKNFELGPIDEDGEFMEELRIMFFTYELDGTEETFEAGFYDDNGTDAYVEIEGTCKGDVHEGTFECEGLEFDYKISGNRYDATVTLSNISNGSEELGVALTIDYRIADDCIEFAYGVKGDMDGAVVDIKYEIYLKSKNINITTPKNYLSIKDIDMDTLMDWATKLEQKYPELMELMEDYAMGNSFGGGYADYPDFDYDYGYDYDYSFDIDDYEDYLDDYSFNIDDFENDYNF